MNRIGVCALPVGLGSALGLALVVGTLAGCSGSPSGSTHQDARSQATVAARSLEQGAALPGAELTKLRDGAGDLRRVRFRSRALGRTDSYLIYLPRGYANMAKAGKRFPVLYLLHGDGRHQRHDAGHLFQRGHVGAAVTTLTRSGRIKPMLVVMPESTDHTVVGDTEWANTSRGRFASNVIDLVHAVDRTWPTIASRSARGIAGLSMGGYGAMNIALHHLGLFSVAESWSGYFHEKPTGPFLWASPKTLKANSPADYVTRLRSRLAADPLHVLLYISRADPLRIQQRPFASRLESFGVPVSSYFFGGPHNFALWSKHMGLALRFADRWLTGG